MTATDTDALTERIEEHLHNAMFTTCVQEPDGEMTTYVDAPLTEVVRITAEEMRKAKAEALREAAVAVDLDKVAEEWSQGPGNRNDMHWAAGNAASSVVATLHDLATEYETGDQ